MSRAVHKLATWKNPATGVVWWRCSCDAWSVNSLSFNARGARRAHREHVAQASS